MDNVLFTVLRCRPQRRHGNIDCYGTTSYLEDGGAEDTYARCWDCLCGEALHDGDPCLVVGDRVIPVHINCEEL